MIDAVKPSPYDPFQAIEDAECEADPIVRERLLGHAIEFLTTCGDLQSASVQYALGYAWYLHRASTETHNDRVHHHLQTALRIDPTHKFALLYLGHHYFDLMQFGKALEILVGFDGKEFGTLDQSWRDAKVSELVLCCRLRLRDRENLEESVRRFCESLTYCDEVTNPSPTEIAETLLALVDNNDVRDKAQS